MNPKGLISPQKYIGLSFFKLLSLKIHQFISICLLILIYALSKVFVYQGLFDIYINLDILFHFAGGLTVSYFYYSFFFKKFLTTSPLQTFVQFVLFSTSIGTVWELYECLSDRYFQTTFQLSNYDTMQDLVVDIIAAVLFSIIIIFIERHHDSTSQNKRLKTDKKA